MVESKAKTKTASEVVAEFFEKEGIVVIQDVSQRDIKTVSDGSVIIEKPIVTFRYK